MFIQKAVDSAKIQSWPNKEIIIVDDGSDSRTKKVLNDLKLYVDNLITQENLGVSVARNKGIEASRGEYILVLDSDDYFEPEFCKKAINVISQNHNVKIVTCYSKWFDEKHSQIFKPVGGDIRNFLMHNSAMGSALFRKADWERVGGYDNSMQLGYEDWEFYIRLLKEGGHAHVIPKILFNYRNKNNSRNKRANLARFKIYEYIFNKHQDLYKANFRFFTTEWLKDREKSETYKRAIINSLDYKVGSILLKPLRLLGLFKK
jgi:glycosyltransferase involved in cell wall biosynthesis